MTILSSFFGRFRAKKPDPAAIATIKGWVLEYLTSPETITLSVNEIDCHDPGCPGVETVILVMERGKKTRAYKIEKSIEDVEKNDVRLALEKR